MPRSATRGDRREISSLTVKSPVVSYGAYYGTSLQRQSYGQQRSDAWFQKITTRLRVSGTQATGVMPIPDSNYAAITSRAGESAGRHAAGAIAFKPMLVLWRLMLLPRPYLMTVLRIKYSGHERKYCRLEPGWLQ